MTSKSFKTYANTPLTYKIQKPRHWYIEKNIITPEEDTTYNETVVPYNGLQYDVNLPFIKIEEQNIWNNNSIAENKYVVAQKKKEINTIKSGICINSETLTAKGFSTSRYITLKEPFDPNGKTWEVQVKITTASDVSTGQYIFDSCKGTGSSGQFGIAIGVIDNKFLLNASADGSNWFISQGNGNGLGSYEVLPNTTYWIKISFNGKQYKLSYSLDGSLYLDDIVVNSTLTNYTPLTYTYFGVFSGDNKTHPFFGEIDFSETSLKIDDKIVWTIKSETEYLVGENIPNYQISGSPTIVNNVVSGFSSSNYLTINTQSIIPNTFDIQFKITTNANDETSARILNAIGGSDTVNGLYIVRESKDIQLVFYDGSSYRRYVAISGSEDGVTYIFRWVWDGTTVKSYYSTTTEEDFILNEELEATSFPLAAFNYSMGVRTLSPKYTLFNGSIDLNKSYIKINDEMAWNINKLKLYDVVGVIKNINNVVSGFSGDNFLTIGYLYLNLANSWEMKTKITTGSDVTTTQNIFVENRADYNSNFYISQGKFVASITPDHSSAITFNEVSTITTVQPNTTYHLKYKYNNNIYTLESSLDGITWNLEREITSDRRTNNWQWNIGCANTNNSTYDYPFKGSVDLNESYIKINDGYVWGDNNSMQTINYKSTGCLENEHLLTEKTYTAFINNDDLILKTEDVEQEGYDWANQITIPTVRTSFNVYKKNFTELGEPTYIKQGNMVLANISNGSLLIPSNVTYNVDTSNDYEHRIICRASTPNNASLQVLFRPGVLQTDKDWYGLNTSNKLTTNAYTPTLDAVENNSIYWFGFIEKYTVETGQYTHTLMYIKDTGYTFENLPDISMWKSISTSDTTSYLVDYLCFDCFGDYLNSNYNWKGLIDLTNVYVLYNNKVVWTPLTKLKYELEIKPSIPADPDIGGVVPEIVKQPYYAYTPASNSFLTTINNNEGGNYNTDVFYALSNEIGTHQKLYMLNSSNNKMIEITNLELKITDSSIEVYPFTSSPSFFQPVALTTATRTQSKDLLGSEVEGIEDTCTYMPSYN